MSALRENLSARRVRLPGTTGCGHMTTGYSPLLPRYISQLERASGEAPVLDLACGSGRNGLYLIDRDIPVVFADRDPAALAAVEQAILDSGLDDSERLVTLWPVDLEAPAGEPLAGQQYAGILVFRSLHRPLFEAIKQAVCPGGVVIYETFTVDPAQFGRPKNPDYMLRHGDLAAIFSGWQVLHSFAGVVVSIGAGVPRAIALFVAIKDP